MHDHKRTRDLLIIAAAWLLAVAPLAAAEQWREVRSPHFVVYSNASERQARTVAREFEEIRAAFSLWFPGMEMNPRPMRIFALSTVEEMYEFTGSGPNRDSDSQMVGYFVPNPLAHDIVLAIRVDTQHGYGVLYHEYFHALTEHSLPGLPTWLNEGLAEVFANATIDQKRIRIGLPNQARLRYLGQAKWFDLDVLLDLDRTGEALSEDVGLYYSQSWALAHYFVFAENGTLWPKLFGYLEAVAGGQPEPEAWEERFGPRQKTQRALWRYLNRGRFSSRLLTESVEIDQDLFELRPISKAEADQVRASHLALTNRAEIAQSILAGVPEAEMLPVGHEAAGVAARNRGDTAGALRHLRLAAEQGGDRAIAPYVLGQLEMSLPTEGAAQRAESEWLRAMARASWFSLPVEALALYYRQVDEGPERALALAKRAARQANGVARHHLVLAGLERASGNVAAAERSLGFARYLALTGRGGSEANELCWFGARYGFAGEVLEICDLALHRDPDNGAYADSRAVVRAVLGDRAGAIADLDLFLSSDAAKSSPEIVPQRRAWRDALAAGEHPITEEVLRGLRLAD